MRRCPRNGRVSHEGIFRRPNGVNVLVRGTKRIMLPGWLADHSTRDSQEDLLPTLHLLLSHPLPGSLPLILRSYCFLQVFPTCICQIACSSCSVPPSGGPDLLDALRACVGLNFAVRRRRRSLTFGCSDLDWLASRHAPCIRTSDRTHTPARKARQRTNE